MGTWGMGGKFERDDSNFDESVAILRYGFELGITLVDVAELHGEGLTEQIVGEAMRGFPRETITVISKVSRDHLSYDDVLKAAERSLERLQTDYIDLYLIHKLPPHAREPARETLSAMESLMKKGIVRHIGVSNFNAIQMEQASRYLTNTRLEASEIEYNLVYQEAGNETIPYCTKNDIHVIAHRPLAKGLLTASKNELLEKISKKYDKTYSQIALNWIISQNITAIPKAGSPEHLKENVGALGWTMEKEDIELLRTLEGFMPYEKIQL